LAACGKKLQLEFLGSKSLGHNSAITKWWCRLRKHQTSHERQDEGNSQLNQPLFEKWRRAKQIRHNYCFKACQIVSAIKIADLLTTFLETSE
jgi:hypothetical protein